MKVYIAREPKKSVSGDIFIFDSKKAAKESREYDVMAVEVYDADDVARGYVLPDARMSTDNVSVHNVVYFVTLDGKVYEPSKAWYKKHSAEFMSRCVDVENRRDRVKVIEGLIF